MANPEHVEIVKQGAEAIRKWQNEHQYEYLDLSEVYLENENLQGVFLHGANLQEAILRAANLQGAFLHNTNFRKAKLSEACFQGAFLLNANLQEADLRNANLRETSLSEANLQGADLDSADLQGASLHEANLQGAILYNANLQEADLYSTNIREALLRTANLSQAILTDIRGSERAFDLDRIRLDDGDALYFDECQRPLPERWLDWERLRTVGRLPIFGVSYTVLILIPIVFYGLAFYNNKVILMRAWAEAAGATADHPLHRVATLILATLHPQPIPSLSLVLLLSTLFLAVGSTLFTFFCPSRVREFSREQWCDQMQRPLLYYWPLSWKYRGIRIACAVCYSLGGIGALWVIGNKIWSVARFIYDNSAFPLPWR